MFHATISEQILFIFAIISGQMYTVYFIYSTILIFSLIAALEFRVLLSMDTPNSVKAHAFFLCLPNLISQFVISKSRLIS